MKLREHYNLDEMLDFFDKMYAMAKEHFEDQTDPGQYAENPDSSPHIYEKVMELLGPDVFDEMERFKTEMGYEFR